MGLQGLLRDSFTFTFFIIYLLILQLLLSSGSVCHNTMKVLATCEVTVEVEGVQTTVNIAIRGMSVFCLVEVKKSRSLQSQNKTCMAQ
jgi:hypothetical protein